LLEFLLMSSAAQPGSSSLLLMRLATCPLDAETWDQFVRRYSGPIYSWCRRHQLQDADARDVTQNVFTKLLYQLPSFDRSRARFRTWLYRIVENAVKDWCTKRAQRQEKEAEAVWRFLATEEARRDLEARLKEEFDLELVEIAEMQVRLRVVPHVWDAYQLFCKDRLSLKDASRRLGIPATNVSKYARRVRTMLAQEIAVREEPEDFREIQLGVAE
jgi:RNA polymerase sigma-70 factor (ECF subfamily)